MVRGFLYYGNHAEPRNHAEPLRTFTGITLNPIQLVWLFVATMAVVALLKLMDRKRSQLSQILREYARKQLEWAQKRAKSLRLARIAAANHDDVDSKPERSESRE